MTAALPDFEGESPRRILEWTFDRFGDRAALSTAFGPSGVALMHLAAQVNPGARVFFVDTGFHFAETLEMIERVQARLAVNIQVIEPAITIAEQARRHGDALYVLNSDQCCAIRKVEPTRRMLSGLDSWITGLRRDQGKTRAATPVLEQRVIEGRTLVKVNPLVTWSRKDVWRHIFTHDLPYNPLHDENYPSVGCAPCTRPAVDAADERSGRWVGQNKTECGLHTSI
jgi:phosphoadenosine phosphosulfate reductase